MGITVIFCHTRDLLFLRLLSYKLMFLSRFVKKGFGNTPSSLDTHGAITYTQLTRKASFYK